MKGPRCVFPFGEDCKRDSAAQRTSTVKDGSRKEATRKSRTLLEEEAHEQALVPYSANTAAARRLATRAADYADMSKCMVAAFDLIPYTTKIIFKWSTIIAIGPVRTSPLCVAPVLCRTQRCAVRVPPARCLSRWPCKWR